MPKIVVAKALCTPARDAVTGVLKPYGVRFSIRSYSRGPGDEELADNALDAYVSVAEVTVSDAAAAWAEYLLRRSNQFILLSKPIDKRNIQWAAKWNGEMPGPWVEAGCKRTPAPASANPRPTTPRERRAQRRERY